jgi:hypothetical protein
VRAGIEQVARRDDRRAGAGGVAGDGELADHVVGGRALRIRQRARDPCHDRQRPQVDEHVPRVAQHDGIVRTKTLLGGDRDGDVDGVVAHPKPYVPGNLSASRRTSSAAGRPTTLR